jgi:hypothetical protein
VKVTAVSPMPVAATQVISLRCPQCRQRGTFETAGGGQDVHVENGRLIGYRRCPNPACHSIVFFVYDVSAGQKVLASYPAERIDFDTAGVPQRLVAAMEEAITCHADGCYTAAAIMVRKTLELLCAENGASGANLKERIAALGNKIVLPQALLSGLDDLRLLGNDAAHIESQVFNDVGVEEVEAGIDLAKEVLKATYQYQTLIDKIRALKRPSP